MGLLCSPPERNKVMDMKILFTEVEPADEETIKRLFEGHQFKIYNDIPTEDELIEMADEDTEVISPFIYTKIGKKTMDVLPNLKLIATRSTGFDHIDWEYARSKGITVCNVPYYGSNTVAEHAFALLLNLVRHVCPGWTRVRSGNFSYEGFRGIDLKGKTLGVLGTGRIGLHAARIGKGFGMEVIAYDVILNEKAAEEIGFTYVSFDELLSRSDVITIHVPLLKSTYHLIDKEAVSKMKRGAILINTARGGVVDTDAIMWGLQEGILKGVGLDVIENEKSLTADHPLLRMEGVLITPHIAFYTHEAMTRIITTTYENITSFEKGSPINVVN
ncbi:MAG: hydroxyacid dehydrogenase [Thermoplasmata archaeon]|nr:MAG: hydroxyacid dehydrogenase [Thermoplasmata archaeon]RLF74494.1 MAG: hydroxyacid dehydrogenase [Thermoplasmata archaeon]